jgi:hypothetical protein
MTNGTIIVMIACVLTLTFTTLGLAANKETIETVTAYSGELEVRVNVFARNEVGLLEYFNLIIFDDTKLDYLSIDADRGMLWYGAYPTYVDGNRIYVHGVATAPTYCMDPDFGDPGSPLYHITFNVKPGQGEDFASVGFSSEGAYDGHWNDCAGGQISPDPDYYDGGVLIMGQAGHLTIGTSSAAPGEQTSVDVYLHNDLDIYEYFNRILYDDGLIDVDSIVALRGDLHYGNYPTHVAGDTVYVHGWASGDVCFYADHTYPGAALYRLYMRIDEGAPPDYTIPLTYLSGGLTWDHWVGCDLVTTDTFGSTDGWVYVEDISGVEIPDPVARETLIERVSPNPASGPVTIGYYLPAASRPSLDIFDVLGRRVRSLDAPGNAGRHEVTWDGLDSEGRAIPSGVYWIRLSLPGEAQTVRAVHIR